MTLWRSSPKLADGALVLVGDMPVRLKVNGRARRISLRIDPAKGEAVAIAPTARRLTDAVRFAETRTDWIIAQLQRLPQSLALTPGAVIQLDGAPCRLERAAMRIKPHIIASSADETGRLIASGEGEAYARAVIRALKAKALDRLSARTMHYVALLAQPAPEITVMDARMRWGSCRGGWGGEVARIRYNWRLILAPPWVLDYVAAHEVAHLIEANHSPAYWAVVRTLFGDHRAARTWLRAHGATLHAVGG